MADDFANDCMQQVVARILINNGYESVNQRALHVLSDVMKAYISNMGEYAQENAYVGGRAKVGTQDMIAAIHRLTVDIRYCNT